MFAHQHWGVEPDIITLAKGIASGYMPLAATVAKRAVFEAFAGEPASHRHFRHINTFGGHPVAAAVGLRNLEIVEREKLVESAAVTGKALLSRLERLTSHPNVGDVRGKGLLLGVELVADKASRKPAPSDRVAAVLGRCADRGVIIGRTAETSPGHGNILIIAPPFVAGEAEIDLLSGAIEAGIDRAFGER
jgi:adenosylmethionine-8-amino-7-oxononanoate aminotransferase